MKRRYCKQRSSAERAKWYGCIPNGIVEVKSEAHPASRGRTAQLPEDRAEHVGARSVDWPRNPWLRPSTGWRARYPLIEGIRRMVPWVEAQVKAARQKQCGALAFWVGRQVRVRCSGSLRRDR